MNVSALLNSVDKVQSPVSFFAENENYDTDAFTIIRLLSCPLCRGLFSDPVTFPCGNTFCRMCLVPLASNNKLHCPIVGCNRCHSLDARTDVSVHKLTDISRRELKDFVLCTSRPYDGRSITTSFDLTHLKDVMLQELECQVCSQLFVDPITTPCGHTYCKPCLTRSLDHNDKCPLCRHRLHNYNRFHANLVNKTITHFIIQLYPDLHFDRKRSMNSEFCDDTQDTPIFVASLVFPKMRCFLDIIEPKHRLMIRRCRKSQNKQFGMVLKRGDNYTDYGTMLKIMSTEVLSDGRSTIETVGTYRFKVIQKGMKDGYDVGKIERIDDIGPDEELERERAARKVAEMNNQDPTKPQMYEPTISELINLAHEFIESLRNGYAPWLLQRLNSTYGDMPDDPSDFSFWIASMLPIDEHEKYKLLEERSVRERFKIILAWINQLKEQWWFAHGCSVS